MKIGTAPFKAGAWDCFHPCDDPPDSPGGTPPDPCDGKVESIFLSDDQKPLSRKGGVITITGHLVGRPGAVANFRAQVQPGAAGFRADLQAERDRLVTAFNAGRAESKELKRMGPESLEKRCLFRSEVLQEIAECAGQAQASNHGLQTVDEAPPPPPPPAPQAP